MRGHQLIAAVLALALASRGEAGTMAEPICTDRPGKGSAPCAAPKGHWQVETSLANWSLTRTRDRRERTLTIGDTAVKYGVTDRLHVELAAPLLVSNWTRTAGVSSRASGFGDVKAKLKLELNPKGAAFAAALYPFVKIPTASKRIGNGRVEGGLIVPLNLSFGESPWSLAASPQFELLLDSDGHGYHASMTQQASLGYQATKALSLSAELWGSWDWDPAGTTTQASLDGSIAYKVSSEFQVDGGINLGLNRNTADIELYGGVSVRF